MTRAVVVVGPVRATRIVVALPLDRCEVEAALWGAHKKALKIRLIERWSLQQIEARETRSPRVEVGALTKKRERGTRVARSLLPNVISGLSLVLAAWALVPAFVGAQGDNITESLPVFESSDGCVRVENDWSLTVATSMHFLLTNTGRQPITVISFTSRVSGTTPLDFWWVPTDRTAVAVKDQSIYLQPGQAVVVATFWPNGEHDPRFTVLASDGQSTEVNAPFSQDPPPPALASAIGSLPDTCDLLKELHPSAGSDRRGG